MNRLEMINELSEHPDKKFRHGDLIISRRVDGLICKDDVGYVKWIDTGIFTIYDIYEEVKENKLNIVIEDMIKKLERMKVE